MNATLERSTRDLDGVGSESTVDVWKQALASYDGRSFVSWEAALDAFEELYLDQAESLPHGATAQHLLEVARQAEWLQEREGRVVLTVPPEWYEARSSSGPRQRKSALSE